MPRIPVSPLLVAVACSAAAIAAACGNGTPTSGGGGTASTGGSPVGSAGVRLGTPVVQIAANDQLRFSPATQTVAVGAIVQWTNPGTVAHTVTFDSEPSLTDPALLAPGSTWEARFTKAGTYPYRCTIHPGMNGTLVVK